MVYWINSQNIYTITYQETLLNTILLLVSKIFESLQCIFKRLRLILKMRDVTDWEASNYNTYIAQVKTSRWWHLVRQKNITWKTFFLKNLTQNVVDKLAQDSFLKSQNWTWLRINRPKFHAVWFYYMFKSRTTKIY